MMASKEEHPEWFHIDTEAEGANQNIADDLAKPQRMNTESEDPFGAVESGEVQYRTMSWW